MAYERLVKKLTKENLWLYVIKVLKNKPMYGYEVKKAIKEKFKFSPSTVTVYAVLYKLSKEGLIKKVKRNGDTYYSLTEKGVEAFEKAKLFINTIREELFED
ncbi:MAG: PadR family transcriptional regulator [archaeon GB-1867-005]|nr:PadR family transcriptional regulator [Candidatus Culexmicrobium cathedralense]